MRTELARVQTEAQKQSMEENGFELYQFFVNGGYCSACEEVAKKKTKYGTGVYRIKDLQPGLNAAPIHPNCRCSIAPYEDSDEYKAWLDFLDKGGTTEEWEKRIRISSPGSTKSLKRSLEDIKRGKAGLNQKRKKILERAKKSGDYHKFEKGEIKVKDLAYLSAATGHEFALFRGKRNDILVHGTKRTCDIYGELYDEIIEKHYKWVAHSHVDMGKLVASREDRDTLKKIKQKTSIIIGIDGKENMFGIEEF